MRDFLGLIFIAVMAALDMRRDWTYGTDAYHLWKWLAWYPLMIAFVWKQWPLMVFHEHDYGSPRWRFFMPHNIPKWVAAICLSQIGWIASAIGVGSRWGGKWIGVGP